jgi:translation initiation factor SUI1
MDLLDTPVLETPVKIHIRVQQQRNNCSTIIEGLPDDLDMKRIARAMRKTLHCACKVIEVEAVIQLQGDHSAVLKDWLLENEIIDKNAEVVTHGL